MRALTIAAIVAVVIIGIFAFGLVDIDQTRETKLPQVEVQGGQTPKFDVDTADVDVGTKNATIEVPKVDVDTKKEKIPVPTVEVKKKAD